jgi:hypothetical protein
MASNPILKNKIFYAPRAYSKRKINIWHTSKPGRKNSVLFKKHLKFFSAELNRGVSRKVLAFNFKPKTLSSEPSNFSGFLNQSVSLSMGSIQIPVKAWQPLLFGSYWMFYVPIAVPGAIRLRRFKHLFRGIQHSNRNANVWFGGLSTKQLRATYNFYLNLFNKEEKVGFCVGSEQLWPILFLKLGFFKTTKAARNYVQNKVHFANPKVLKLSMMEPGMMFTLVNPCWGSLYHSFIKNILYKV